MNKNKKIISIAIVVIGAVLLLFSDYIAKEVAEGKLQIEQGQKSVDTVKSVFSVSPVTKPIGKEFTGSAQKRIDAGSAEAAKYEALSNQLRIGGIILIVLGVGLFFFWKKKH